MAVFTYTPSKGFTKQSNPRVLVAQFGDGYSQRLGDGINPVSESWSLNFGSIDITTAQNIVSFFETHKGYIAFDWTPPGDLTAIKVICDNWSAQYESHISRTLTASFKRVYEA